MRGLRVVLGDMCMRAAKSAYLRLHSHTSTFHTKVTAHRWTCCVFYSQTKFDFHEAPNIRFGGGLVFNRGMTDGRLGRIDIVKENHLNLNKTGMKLIPVCMM